MLAALKKKTRYLARTPLHPQWLHRSNTESYCTLIEDIGTGKAVLDIGCYNKWAQQHLARDCWYVGLDYYETASQWYGSVPDVYGDALSLPIASGSFDAVILVDVLEHISDTGVLLEEVYRVLKPGGKAVIAFPFLYPLHDAPRDFVRLTEFGMSRHARLCGFDIEICDALGSPIVTSVFLFNVALTKTAVNWLSRKSVWSLIAVFFPPVILVANLFAKALSRLEVPDAFMANSFQAVLRKPEHSNA